MRLSTCLHSFSQICENFCCGLYVGTGVGNALSVYIVAVRTIVLSSGNQMAFQHYTSDSFLAGSNLLCDVFCYFGLKSVILDGEMTFNAAVYYNRYRNMHAQSFVETCVADPTAPGGERCTTSEFTENGGEIDAYGIEADMQWRPSPQTFINATMAFNDSEFGE